MSDNVSLLNMIIALARTNGITPKKFVEEFNRKEENQAYYDECFDLAKKEEKDGG